MLGRTLTLLGIEWLKLRRQPFPLVCSAAILLVTVVTALFTAPGCENGFDSLARCLNATVPLAAIFLVALGALQFSSEATHGVLRLVLPKPIRRGEWVLAKALCLSLATVLLLALIVAVAGAVVAALHGFQEIRDKTFQEVVHRARDAMFRDVGLAVALLLPPLMAAALFGFLCSTLVDNAGIAVAVAVVVYLVIHAAVQVGFHHPGPYNGLPVFFSSFLGWPIDAIDQFSRGIYTYRWKPHHLALNVAVPFGYWLAQLVAAWLWFRRKDVLS